MKKSFKTIAIASVLCVLAASGTAFAAPAAWHLSTKRGVNPDQLVPYKHSWTNNGVTKRADWWVGWNFGTATASSNTTNATPHQSVTNICRRAGFADKMVLGATWPATTPTGWSGAGGPQTNWAHCGTGWSAIQGQVGIFH
jgi:hypothetical protein